MYSFFKFKENTLPILAEEIAKVLKATFAKAMASNPAAAAEMARSMAEALAATGIFFFQIVFSKLSKHFFWNSNIFL